MGEIEIGKQYTWNYRDVTGEVLSTYNDGAIVKVLRRDESDTYWITEVVAPATCGRGVGYLLWALAEELTAVKEPETVLDATVEEFAVNVAQNLRVVALSLAVQAVSALPKETGTFQKTADDFYAWLTQEEN